MRKFMTMEDAVVPMMHPRILVNLACARGARLADVLDATGIPAASLSSPEARISYRQFARLVDNACRLSDDAGLGVDLGQEIHLQNLGMLGVLVMNSHSVGEAVDACLMYHRGLAPIVECESVRDGDWVRIGCRFTLPLGPFQHFCTEMLLGVIDNTARVLLPDQSPIEAVHVDYARPAHISRYARYRVKHFHFGSDRLEVVLDARALSLPLGPGDPILAELARRECAAQLTPFSQDLLGLVRGYLQAKPGRYPSMDELAAHLQTSQRSLRRHLASMQMSYQGLVDDAKRMHADHALANTTRPLDEVALQLGYGDARSFRRAWLRWTGMTPSEYRRARRA